MKKSIQKPINWQDFESLCKMLFGEVWEIPLKIKKNGRSGQPQAGVDISRIPKNEKNYWGIQCKGKEGGLNSKLTKKEIDTEIKKAQTFNPKLEVFIFATTMQKDAKIEEYIRIKDIENRQNGGFEILLFCWGEISDLIDENRNTYNFWVKNQLHITKFNFDVYLNDFEKEITIRPKCVRSVLRYKLKEIESENKIKSNEPNLTVSLLELLNAPSIEIESIRELRKNVESMVPQGYNQTNEALFRLKVLFQNNGSTVIEDYSLTLKINSPFRMLNDYLKTSHFMVNVEALTKKTSISENKIYYSPRNNETLIQKACREFDIYLIPEFEKYEMEIEWQLLARDYDSKGNLLIKVEPQFEDEIEYQYVDSKELLVDDYVIGIKAKKITTFE